MGPVDIAERSQIREPGCQIATVPGGQRVRPGHHHLRGPGGLGVCLLQHPFGVCTSLREHLIAAAPRILRKLAAVLLRIRHITVGRLLGVGQDADGLDMRILGTVAGHVADLTEHPAPQPLDFLPERGLLVE